MAKSATTGEKKTRAPRKAKAPLTTRENLSALIGSARKILRKEDGVSLDVGFYYMSNALGRLIGTLLSGWVFQAHGLVACLWVSSAFVLAAALISSALPRHAEAVG